MQGGKCWNCGTVLAGHEYGRETDCLKCAKPTRVCKNCRWYDSARTNQCIEPVAEPIQEKAQPNYCEFFEPTDEVEKRGGHTQEDHLKAAEALFKL